MAKPAFIYAFDNLGPEHFIELSGLLLASRYKGFIMGGVGADGGIDGEIAEILGEWRPEAVSPLLNEIIQPGKFVVFQFKHKVTARVGQAQARTQLLDLYKCQPNKKCELHRKLILQKRPSAYVLVTNVEVNSGYRHKFIEQCKLENRNIKYYQIIGLDELEVWVTSEVQLRHLYFPTIFGEPRFNLHIKVDEGFGIPNYGGLEMDFDNTMAFLQVSVMNIGNISSYINTISFKAIVDGEQRYIQMFNLGDPILDRINPKFGTPLEAGRKQVFYYPFEVLQRIKKQGKDVYPFEVIVTDEIGNQYSTIIPVELINKVFKG